MQDLGYLYEVYSENNSGTWWTDGSSGLVIHNTNTTVGAGPSLKLRGADARITWGEGGSSDTLTFSSRESEGTARETITFDNNGKVGIGNMTPGYRIDVVDQNPTDGIIGRLYNISASGLTGSKLWFAQNTVANWNIGQPAGTNAFVICNSTGSASERMRIDSSGNVGIGTTAPGYPLDVQFAGDSGIRAKSSSSHASLYVQSHANNSAYIRFSDGANRYWLQAGADDKLHFRPNATSTTANQIIFDSVGKIGVGISPSYKLDVNGTARLGALTGTTAVYQPTYTNAWGSLADVASYSVLKLHGIYGSSAAVHFGALGSGRHGIQVTQYNGAAAYDLAIQPYGGNVGIGTATSTYNLKVQGTSKITGTLSVGGVFSTDSNTTLGTIASNSHTINGTLDLDDSKLTLGGSGGTAGYHLQTDGSGNVSWAAGTAGFVDGSGTANYIPKWTDGDTIGNSIIYDSGSNIGIGTAAPTEKLDVEGSLVLNVATGSGLGEEGIFFRRGYSNSYKYNVSIFAFAHDGSGNFSDGISINGYDGVSFCTGSNTRQERMRIVGGSGSTSGYVGIGTTAPAYELEVAGTISNYGDGKMIRLRSDDYIIAQIEHRGTGVNYDKGYFRLFDTGVTKVVLDSAGNSYINGGNVGIGTSAPGAKLHIYTGSYNTPKLILQDTGAGAGLVNQIEFRHYTDGRVQAYIKDEILSGWSTKLHFGTANSSNAPTTKMTIDGSGKVGIGENAPLALLHLKGGTATDEKSHILFENTAGAKKFAVGGGGSGVTNNGLGFRNVTDNTLPMIIDDSGKVGIGTASPSNSLHIAADAPRIRLEDTLGTSNYSVISADNGQLYLSADEGQNQGNSAVIISVDNAESLRAVAGGNVGIGTDAPGDYKLNVNGYFKSKTITEQTYYPYTVSIVEGTNAGNMYFQQGSTSGYVTKIHLGGRSHADAGIQFSTRSLVRVTIDDANGNVGIGTAANLNSILNVYGGTSSGPTSTITCMSANATVGGGAGIFFKTSNNHSLNRYGAQISAIRNSSNNGSPDLVFNLEKTDATGLAERMRITGGGNVGIGTTAPASPLAVVGAADGGIRLYKSDGTTVIGKIEGTGSEHGNLSLYNNAGTIKASLKSSGGTSFVLSNFAIGAASASEKLQVHNGSILMDSDWGLKFGGSNAMIEGNSSGTILRFNASAGFKFTDGGTTQVAIDTNGNVGIGYDNPECLLDLKKSINAPLRINLHNQSTNAAADATISFETNGQMDWGMGIDRTDGHFKIGRAHTLGTNTVVQLDGSGTISAPSVFIDASDGKVGIGTTAPSQLLHVKKSSNDARILIETTGAGAYLQLNSVTSGYAGIEIYGNSGANWSFGQYGFSDLSVIEGGMNGTRRVTFRAGGNVGIGTTVPGAKLMVGAPTRQAGTAVQQQAGYFIGTKSAFANSAYKGLWQNQLHVADDSALAAGIGGAITFGATQDNTNGTYLASIEGSRDNATSGQYGASMIFRTRTNGVAAMGAHMVIASDGNVGIGTTAPEAPLVVAGSGGNEAVFRSNQATATERAGGGFSSLGSATATSRYARLFLDADGANFGGTDYFAIEKFGNSGEVKLLQYSNANMSFWVNTSTQAMTIKNDGDVGIGATPVNNYRLEVYDGDYTQMMLRAPTYPMLRFKADQQNSGNNGRISIGANNVFQFNPNSTTNGISIANDGNVGIGTTAPSQKLHVVGKALITDDIQLTGSNPRIDFNTNGVSALRFYDTTNSAERMRIASDGEIRVAGQTLVDSANTNYKMTFPDNSGIAMGSAYTFANIYGSSGIINHA